MARNEVIIRPLVEGDLRTADRIMRVAFGTFLGLEEPASYMGDGSYVQTRWRSSPETAFAAEADGHLVGSNFATRWGSFAFFGPLTIHPSEQDRGYGGMLIDPVIALFERWEVTHTGLFTFAQSPKHIGLYQKYGFRPRALTLIMEKPVADEPRNPAPRLYSELSEDDRVRANRNCRRVTDAIYPGLDLTAEIESIFTQSLGDTVLDPDMSGFAACHRGSGSEAGAGACYIKFGAVEPGPHAPSRFRNLLTACEDFARETGEARIVAGVSAARIEAYDEMLASGYRVTRTGVAMHRPNEGGFSRPGVFVIDDWR